MKAPKLFKTGVLMCFLIILFLLAKTWDKSNDSSDSGEYTVQDGRAKNQESSAKGQKAKENNEQKRFTLEPLTIHCNSGRLGNQMSTYATLYGIARYNNRIPRAQHCNMKHLRPYFKLTVKEIPDMPEESYINYDITRYLREEDLYIPQDVNILTGFRDPRSFTFYHAFKDEIRREFSFKDHIDSYATEVLRNLNKGRRYKTYIGVHIRRTDFCTVLRKYRARPFDMEYLTKAMAHFRQKYDDVVFVIASDNRKWCHKSFEGMSDVVIAPYPPRAIYDFAVLAQCNHSIITHGSFGYWVAYLAGGETVYFTGNYAPDSPVFKNGWKNTTFFPPEWIGISTTPEDYWKTHTADECKL